MTRNNDNDIHNLKGLYSTHSKSQLVDNLVGRDFSISMFLESLLDGIQSREYPWVTRSHGAVL